ncbi:unnamed protein product [Closterium sp. NIES-53]
MKEQLDRLVSQLEDSTLEVPTLTAELDAARWQSVTDAPAPTPTPANVPAQTDEPIVISPGTSSQHDSVGQRSGVTSDAAAQSMPGMTKTRAIPTVNPLRETRRHVEFTAPVGNDDIYEPMPLKPQRPPCFDPSQRGSLTVESWIFTMNMFFYDNYVISDATKIRYAFSLQRGPAMDWWRVIVTSPHAYEPPSREEEPTRPAVTWCSFCETAQYSTWDAWCAGLRVRFEPLATLISTRQKLRTWRQLGSVRDYTSGFLALCEQVGYMHEAERVERYVGGLKPDISHEIMLCGLSNFNEIPALAEKIDILRQPRPESYYGHRPRGPIEHATVHAVAANVAAAPLKGRCFACNKPGHRKSECHEELRCQGAEQGRESQRQGNASRSSLYTLTTASPPVSASGQVAASSQVFAAASRSSPASAPCSCHPLSHETLLWHHRLGHPSLPHLRDMASRTLVSSLPRSLPPLPPGPAPTYVPCVEGPQRAAPHSSTFPPTKAPLQTLHMDVWGPARVRGQGHECYFLLVVDDYSRYTTVFPLRSKGEVPEVLIDWIRGAHCQLSERFGSDLPVLRLHSDKGGEFSSDFLRAFCRAEGIRQTFTLPAFPQKNGIAERRIGMYAAHQINLQPRVSLPETTPTLRWTGKVGAAGTGAGGAAGVVTGDPGAKGTGAVSAVSGGAARPRPYYVPLLQQVLGLPPSSGPTPPFLSPPPVKSQSPLQPSSPLPGPSPYSGPSRGLMKRREPESRLVSPKLRPMPPVSHSASHRVPLPSPPASSLLDGPDPESDSLRAASPTATRFLDTAVIDPLFESTAASALVAELSASVCPPSVEGESSLSTDVLEDRQEEFECFATAVLHLVSMLLAPERDPDAPDIPTPRSYAEAIEGPYSSQWQAAMDAKMASRKSTRTYVNEVPPLRANIVCGMCIFRVKRPPGSPPVFKARYVARGFSQQEGVDFFQTFSPTTKMTNLRVLLHVAAHRYYELHSLDFSTAFLQGRLHEEIWLHRPPGFTGSFPAGTLWSLQRPVYGLRQAPRERHDTLRTTLAALGFEPSTADPSLFLCTGTTLPPFYVLVYVDDLVFATADTEALAHVKAQRTITLTQSHMVQQVLQRFGFTYSLPQSTPLPTGHTLSAPPSDESVEPSGPYPELVGCLTYLMTCTRPDFAYPLSILARYVAPGSSCEAEIYAGAMAAKKLRLLTYLLTDLGEAPRSPPLRGQLFLAYVASQANTADVFTKALQRCDHQRFLYSVSLLCLS